MDGSVLVPPIAVNASLEPTSPASTSRAIIRPKPTIKPVTGGDDGRPIEGEGSPGNRLRQEYR